MALKRKIQIMNDVPNYNQRTFLSLIMDNSSFDVPTTATFPTFFLYN